MAARVAEWAPHPNPAESPSHILKFFQLLSTANAKPWLLKDTSGNEALVVASRILLASLTALNLLVGSGVACALRSDDDTSAVAVLSFRQNAAARPAIEALAEMVARAGQTLNFVMLPASDPIGAQPDPGGLKAVADGEIHLPGKSLTLHRRTPVDAEPRDSLLKNRPKPVAEPPDNLRQRSQWFQRRSGRKD